MRPYSLAIVPELDRVVVTSYDMGEDMGLTGGRRERTHVVQVWRLSDLAVLASIDLPPFPGGGGDDQPGEPRLLSDGRSVLVSTFTCGLYRITGLKGESPGAEPIHLFDGGGCAVPVVSGRFWIQSVPSANALVGLDVSNPAAPVEVSRLDLGERSFPHWLALDESSGRIVIADRGTARSGCTSLAWIPTAARSRSTSGSVTPAPTAPAYRSSAPSGRTASPGPRDRTGPSSDGATNEGSFHPRRRVKVSFHPLTPDRWGDVQALFGERGACGDAGACTGGAAQGSTRPGRGPATGPHSAGSSGAATSRA